MRVYFSDLRLHIISSLETADSEIKIAVSWLTDKGIFNLLLDKLNKGVTVSIITRNDYLNNHPDGLDWQKFIDKGGALRWCKEGYLIHYKFCIIDNKTLICCSYNWTCFAGSKNRENIFIINEEDTIETFQQEFAFLSSIHEQVETNERILRENLNPLLLGFYDLTTGDDLKHQQG